MIHHSTVSLDYLQEQLAHGKSAYLGDKEYDIESQKQGVRYWRNLGYTYAPPCDNVTPDGRCAGHEKEVAS